MRVLELQTWGGGGPQATCWQTSLLLQAAQAFPSRPSTDWTGPNHIMRAIYFITVY